VIDYMTSLTGARWSCHWRGVGRGRDHTALSGSVRANGRLPKHRYGRSSSHNATSCPRPAHLHAR